jgi:hypothetical protein
MEVFFCIKRDFPWINFGGVQHTTMDLAKPMNLYKFSDFARFVPDFTGHPIAFLSACGIIVVWLLLGLFLLFLILGSWPSTLGQPS